MDANIALIDHIRKFNRFYTNVLGLLNQHYLSDFSLTEARILFDLDDLGCCTANILSSRLNIDKSYMSRIIKGFEKRGLVNKSISSDDGRAYTIELTQTGRDTIRKLICESNSQIEKLLGPLNAAECDSIYKAMNTIMKLLDHTAENGAEVDIGR